jgi:hypothetical protein
LVHWPLTRPSLWITLDHKQSYRFNLVKVKARGRSVWAISYVAIPCPLGQIREIALSGDPGLSLRLRFGRTLSDLFLDRWPLARASLSLIKTMSDRITSFDTTTSIKIP